MIKKVKHTIDLFYMTPTNISVTELKEAIDKDGNLAHVWEELKVLQIELPNGNTIDFESMKPEFKEPSDSAFIKNRNISTIYAITIEEEDFDHGKSYFCEILNKLGGFICSDSDDFKPIYQVEDLN